METLSSDLSAHIEQFSFKLQEREESINAEREQLRLVREIQTGLEECAKAEMEKLEECRDQLAEDQWKLDTEREEIEKLRRNVCGAVKLRKVRSFVL